MLRVFVNSCFHYFITEHSLDVYIFFIIHIKFSQMWKSRGVWEIIFISCMMDKTLFDWPRKGNECNPEGKKRKDCVRWRRIFCQMKIGCWTFFFNQRMLSAHSQIAFQSRGKQIAVVNQLNECCWDLNYWYLFHLAWFMIVRDRCNSGSIYVWQLMCTHEMWDIHSEYFVRSRCVHSRSNSSHHTNTHTHERLKIRTKTYTMFLCS